MKRRWLVGVLMLIACVALLGAGEYRKLVGGHNDVVTLTLLAADGTGVDTAGVIKIHAYQALDSFVYSCSTYYGTAFTTGDSVFKWVSPLQSMSLTVEATDVDTTTTLNCSIVFGAQTLGFQLVIEDDERDTGVAILVDTLVYLFNNTTNLKDSIIAHDSVSYVKIISRFGEQVIGTWSAIILVDAGAPSDSLDTASIDPTTLTMVTDSLVATINAHTQIGSIITAEALSGDSTLQVTVDKPGLPISITIIDTALDTSLTTAVVDGYSSETTDNIMLGACEGYKTLISKLRLGTEISSLPGLGDADSAILWLYTVRHGEQVLVDSGLCAALPCSLLTKVLTIVGDTLLSDHLEAKVWLSDSTSDTALAVNYRFNWDMILKE